jgi:Na+-driven multidrug efflux pump
VNATFNGMGYPLPGVMLSAARVLFIFLPLAFTARAVLGLEGLFVASALSNLIVGVIAFVWLRHRISVVQRAET